MRQEQKQILRINKKIEISNNLAANQNNITQANIGSFLGNINSFNLYGSILEILVFDLALKKQQIKNLENYLLNKWRI